MAKSISIIVLCHNRWAVTRRCLESLKRSTPSELYEVLAYDNASTDWTFSGLRRLARGWPQLRVVRNKRNLSFAEGVNLGMRASHGRYFLWLNNDTVLAPGWLEGLLKAAKADNAGAVGPMTDHMAPPQQIGPPFRTRVAGRTAEAPFLGGFCFLLRREAAERTGFLDQRFVWGWEDMDYCMRMRQAGERLVLARDVFVHHEGSRTLKNVSAGRRSKMDLRNRQLMLRKWLRAEPWRSEFLNLEVRLPSHWKDALPAEDFTSFVSIIILCRRNWEGARRTLESVRRCAGTVPYEVLASSIDGEPRTVSGLKALEKKWPQLRVVGFWDTPNHAQRINNSVRVARGNNLVILSDDVLVRPGWIEGLLKAAKVGDDVGGVAPLCRGSDVEWQKRPQDGGIQAVARAVPYVRAHCLLIPREVLSRVGDFDERFQSDLWVEDYCHRAVQRGYRILIAGGTTVRRRDKKFPGPARKGKVSPDDLKLMFHKWSGQPLLPGS